MTNARALCSVALVLTLGTAFDYMVTPLAAQQYANQAALASDTAFIDRVKMATVTRAAIIVRDETINTTNFANRVRLANQVARDPNAWASHFAVAVAANKAIRSTSTDAELDAEVSSVWNLFAGPPPPQ